jgi:hypothetical protein
MWFSSLLGSRQRSAPRGRSHRPPRKPLTYRPRLEALEDRCLPSQIGLTVTSLADSGPGTLRAAIQTADSGSHSDKYTISFAVTGTINLLTPLPDLNSSSNITIQGPGASNLTVEPAAGASFSSAIITVDSGTTASLSGLTVANGNAGGIDNNGTLTVAQSAVVDNSVFNNIVIVVGEAGVGEGGGIFNAGTLTVSGSTVSGNSASGLNFGTPDASGGGIFNQGTLTVKSSTLSGNSASDGGGGIENAFTETYTGTTPVFTGGNLTVTASTLSGNVAGSGGGGIDNSGNTTTVSGCTLCGNHATIGGGIYNLGTLTVTGSTLAGNSALVPPPYISISPAGGGIFNIDATATVTNSTLSNNNSAEFGGGIANEALGTLTLSGSTLTTNSATYGGGVYNFISTLTVANSSTFTGNSATYGGGIYNDDAFNPVFGSSVTVRGSALTANTATEGGGIYNTGGALASLQVQNSTFSGNTASDSGAGMYNLGTATLQQSTLSGNTAASNGGGIFNGASGAVTVKDSTVLKNVAPLGADIYNLGALTQDDSTVGVIGP